MSAVIAFGELVLELSNDHDSLRITASVRRARGTLRWGWARLDRIEAVDALPGNGFARVSGV